MSSDSTSPSSGSASGTGSQPSSWGQLLVQYEVDRTRKPQVTEAPVTVRDIKAKQKSSYNPILGTFSDPAQERTYVTQQQRTMQRNIERGARTRTRRDFDIVTNTVKAADGTTSTTLSTEPPPKNSRNIQPPRRDTDIITHRPVKRQEGVRYQEFQPGDEGTVGRTVHKSLRAATQSTREYSIITGRYYDHDEEKKKSEDEQTLRKAALALSKQKRFDILTMKHMDPALEAEEVKREKRRVEMRRDHQEAMIPEGIRNREQRSFDIATNSVKDRELYRQQDERTQARQKARTMRSKDTTERNKYAESVRKEDLTASRAMHRTSFSRFKEEQTRGFDIISNISSTGLHSSPVVPPRVPPRDSPFLREAEFNASLEPPK